MTTRRANAWKARPRWRISRGDEIAIGPGKADLLEAIARHGSISGAAAALGMSYRRAWTLVRTMNQCFSDALVETTGSTGWRGRGAAITPAGSRALKLYRSIEARSVRTSAALVAQLEGMISRSPGSGRRR